MEKKLMKEGEKKGRKIANVEVMRGE